MNKKTPLVSIIINCFNGEKYLAEAINSIYAQTYKNWEIIFWDNASIDGSATIAKSYDNKLKYYHSKSTTTLSYARLQAVKKTKGIYIPADDLTIRTSLNWFDRLSVRQVLESETLVGKYLLASNCSFL